MHAVKVQAIQTDGGKEYQGVVEPLLRELGIRHRSTNPNKPYQNGTAERWNRTIFEGVRAVISSQRVSKTLWGDAAKFCTTIKNSLPTKSLNGKTPFEIWFGRKPDLTNVRVFGCTVYFKSVDFRTKLDDMAKIGIFIGFAEGVKGWKIYNVETRRITTSRDCVFLESADYTSSENYPQYLIDLPWKDMPAGVAKELRSKSTRNDARICPSISDEEASQNGNKKGIYKLENCLNNY